MRVADTLTSLDSLVTRSRQCDEARIAPQALQFPRRIVSHRPQPPLQRDDEIWLRQRLAPLPQACEVTTRGQSPRGRRLAPLQFLPRDLLPGGPRLQFWNKVFCRTHRFDRE